MVVVPASDARKNTDSAERFGKGWLADDDMRCEIPCDQMNEHREKLFVPITSN